jgi:hypothetical protein
MQLRKEFRIKEDDNFTVHGREKFQGGGGGLHERNVIST